jgi:hypothetical protein
MIFEMTTEHKVTVFHLYPFAIGEKIRIEGSRRQGDWEVVGLDGSKITLRCPVSGREFTWERFCYQVREEEAAQWPRRD